jgi:hypothetical protein
MNAPVAAACATSVSVIAAGSASISAASASLAAAFPCISAASVRNRRLRKRNKILLKTLYCQLLLSVCNVYKQVVLISLFYGQQVLVYYHSLDDF